MHPFSLNEKEIEQVSGGTLTISGAPGTVSSMLYGEEGGTPVTSLSLSEEGGSTVLTSDYVGEEGGDVPPVSST